MRRRRPIHLFAAACAIAAGVAFPPVPLTAQAPAAKPAAFEVFAPPFPAATPESVGLSPKGLARITELMQRYVDTKRLAGSVTLILRDGKVAYLNVAGQADVENAVP